MLTNEEIIEKVKHAIENSSDTYSFEPNTEELPKDIIDEDVVYDETTGHGIFYEIKCKSPVLNIFDTNNGKFLGSYQNISIYRYKSYNDSFRQFKSLCHIYDGNYNITMERSLKIKKVSFDISMPIQEEIVEKN